MSHRHSIVVLAALATFALQGCGTSSGGSGLDLGNWAGWGGGGGYGSYCNGPSGTISSATLSSTSAEYYTQLGDSVTLTASVMDGACNTVVVDLMSSWSSSAPEIISVTPQRPSGQRATVHTRGIGPAEVKLSVSGVVGATTLHVVPRIASFTVNPVSASVKVGDSVYVLGTLTDTAGKAVRDVPVTYLSEYTGVIQMEHDARGGLWAFALKPGVVSIEARVLGLSATSAITVVER